MTQMFRYIDTAWAEKQKPKREKEREQASEQTKSPLEFVHHMRRGKAERKKIFQNSRRAGECLPKTIFIHSVPVWEKSTNSNDISGMCFFSRSLCYLCWRHYWILIIRPIRTNSKIAYKNRNECWRSAVYCRWRVRRRDKKIGLRSHGTSPRYL